VYLDGRRKSAQGGFERTRFRCVPREAGEKEHVYLGRMPRRKTRAAESECGSCERVFARAQGYAGASRFAFVIREIATTLVKVGRGVAYREISRDLREAQHRLSRRGDHPGFPAGSGQLASDYTDVFAPVVLEPIAPKAWPPIVAIDSLPLWIADHSKCCPKTPKAPVLEHDVLAPPRFEFLIDESGERVLMPTTTSAPPRKPKTVKPKTGHSGETHVIGHVLVAVGQDKIGDKPKLLLARFVGSGDELSWTEFLISLPGKPTWIVSDGARSIHNAITSIWHGKVIHYRCETHLAKNMEAVARKEDGVKDGDQIFPFIENAQYNMDNWRLAQAVAEVGGYTHLAAWLHSHTRLMASQMLKRKRFGHAMYPRSNGACERGVAIIKKAIYDRMPHFRNAARLNLFLALVVAEGNGQASVAAYSKTLRAYLEGLGGQVGIEWDAIRDPRDGPSSIETMLEETVARAHDYARQRESARRAAAYQIQRATQEIEAKALGIQIRRRKDYPPKVKATGSVAGKRLSENRELADQWHPTRNGDLTPDDVTQGQGLSVWWKCSRGPDHEWPAQIRSRTISGSRCPFCFSRRVAPSEALDKTNPAVAVQWHPTKNGTKKPQDFSYGSEQYAWWQCDRYHSHIWRARINSRTGVVASGCPRCAALAGKGVAKTPEDLAQIAMPQPAFA
jgi:hypothetical protein